MNRIYRRIVGVLATVCATGILSGPVAASSEFDITLLGTGEVKNRGKLFRLLRLDPSVTPWCAAFINYKERTYGRPGTKSLLARSYLKYGQRTYNPQKGDIVVLWRGKQESPYGHVGYFIRKTSTHVYIYGGNQKDEINITAYPIDRVLQYRVPPGVSR